MTDAHQDVAGVAQGYADSLRQQSKWIEETVSAVVPSHHRIDIGDIDTDELKAAANLIESLSKALSEAEAYLHRTLESYVHEHGSPVPEWKPSPDLLGMLMQFDNATTVTRVFKARALAAESRLSEAMKVIEPFAAIQVGMEGDGEWFRHDGDVLHVKYFFAARRFHNAGKE
jgi:hypothetical protein